MSLTYGSVCSGIEAATVAWGPLGWRPAFFAEIDPFPSAVLAHRFLETPNLGDFTAIGRSAGTIDLLVGGTPCQSFSVAGLRKGLADDRGNLALEFLRLAERLGPPWLVWENVPGVLSSNGGRDFGAFLGGLVELGYGFAYRVLDAQYVRVDGFGRAVPQRRRRVFVVGRLGDWRRAAAVLFDRESLSGNPPPRREAGEGVAGTLEASLGRRCGQPGDGSRNGHLVAGAVSSKWAKGTGGPAGDECQNLVAHTLKAGGFDASEDGTGRGVPLVPVVCWDLAKSDNPGSTIGYHFDVTPCLRTSDHLAVSTGWAVRRLMPVECERLQGFPDGHTLVPYRGKPAADGPRYKAIGNSMAVNVMRWLGRRIEMVELFA